MLFRSLSLLKHKQLSLLAAQAEICLPLQQSKRTEKMSVQLTTGMWPATDAQRATMKQVLEHHYDNFRNMYQAGTMGERMAMFVSQVEVVHNGNFTMALTSRNDVRMHEQIWAFSVNPGRFTEQELEEICGIVKPSAAPYMRIPFAVKEWLALHGFRINDMTTRVMNDLINGVNEYYGLMYDNSDDSSGKDDKDSDDDNNDNNGNGKRKDDDGSNGNGKRKGNPSKGTKKRGGSGKKCTARSMRSGRMS